MTGQLIPQEIIRQKRDGETISNEDIALFVEGITDGRVADAQISALAMAIFFNGMSPEEGAALTLSMRDSGDVIDWTGLGFDADAPIVDKHSTGGVGDKVSLMLAPIVAACGGLVPMISGRGLGHTGGTLDKFESIPGYDPYPSMSRFAEITRDVGCSIIGQTGELAPADKRFYAVRDVTATVESIPLITASILSKKLSAGLNSLIMDVKFGSGAFMSDFTKAKSLAKNIVRVATAAGTPTRALLTDMNQVLGTTAGNAVEMIEAIEFMTNPEGADRRLYDVTVALAAHMLVLSGVHSGIEAATRASADSLSDGSAAVVFEKMVAAQGGPSAILSTYGHDVKVAEHTVEVSSSSGGFVAEQDTRAIGMAVVAMGGGRTDPRAKIDHAVGLSNIVQIGDRVEKGEPLALIKAHSEQSAAAVAEMIKSAIKLSDGKPDANPVVAEIVGS